MKPIVLASSSPRRKELLANTGLAFTVHPSSFEEIIDPHDNPEIAAEKLSMGKAADVAKHYKDALIIAADTIVVFEKQIFGKPKDENNAIAMLLNLSGRTHRVITGFTILQTTTGKQFTDHDITFVKFKNLSKREVEEYVKNFQPMDKSGSYAIQEIREKFVEKIEGDIENVIGLPVSKIRQVLKLFDIY